MGDPKKAGAFTDWGI